MKFNAEELKQFKRDLDASLQELSNKYNIDITLGKIAVVDDMFSIRLNAEHRPLPKKAAPASPSKPQPKPIPKKPAKKLDSLSDKDLENLDLDDLDLDDLSDDVAEPAKKEEPKKAEPKKVEPKPAPIAPRKPVVPQKPEPKAAPKKPAKKLDSLSDKDLENLDLDDLDLDDLSDDTFDEEPKKEEPKKVEPKPLKKNDDRELTNELKTDEEYQRKSDIPKDEPLPDAPKKKKKLDELTDEELVNMDFDDIDFGDDEPVEEEPKPKKRKNTYHDDDDSRYDQELERFLNPGKKVSYDRDPSNVFEEKNRQSKPSYIDEDNDDDITDEELEAYMAQSGYYDYSFQAKLIQADSNIQDFYTDVKNLLLSNDGVRSKVMWEYDLFTYKGKPIARLNIEGKTLQVYLGLDPEEYDGSSYKVKIIKDPAYSGTKVLAEISSMSDEDQMYDLIGDLAEAHNIMPGEDRYDDYHFQYESLDELIARGLIKEN